MTKVPKHSASRSSVVQDRSHQYTTSGRQVLRRRHGQLPSNPNFELIRRKHRKILVRLFMAVLFLAVLAFVQYIIFFSSVFALAKDKVHISGTSPYIKQAQLDEIIDQYVGTPTTRINLNVMQIQLNTITGVSGVIVAHNWPKGLNITLTPSEPIAYTVVDDSFQLFDVSAEVLGTETQAPKNLMKIQLDKNHSVASRKAGINLLNALTPFFLEKTTEIKAESNVTLTVVLDDDRQIFLGDDTDLDKKIAVAERIYRQSEDEKKKIIDVSSATSPVLR
ncbi:MAG: cell division protein FtsQ/DivIB [Bifidobacteriaceae bacterium]|nr:cell division protein FtsQ/DivIB [Bifidobacteriaceae bacterium]